MMQANQQYQAVNTLFPIAKKDITARMTRIAVIIVHRKTSGVVAKMKTRNRKRSTILMESFSVTNRNVFYDAYSIILSSIYYDL